MSSNWIPQEIFFHKEVRICARLASFHVCRSPKTVCSYTEVSIAFFMDIYCLDYCKENEIRLDLSDIATTPRWDHVLLMRMRNKYTY